MGVLVRDSAVSLGQIDRLRFWGQINTGFSFERREFGRTQKGGFRGVGVGLGRLGFAGGLGHMGPASCAILGRLTEIGFWCVGLVSLMHHWNPPDCAFYGIEAWKGGQNPEARFGV